MKKINILFFGTSSFAVPVLEKLINNHFNVIGVITQPDKPQGRKKQLVSSPIKQFALKYNLKIIQPNKLTLKDLTNFKADLGISAAYSQIIATNIIKQFPYGIINIHPSLLPKYRGPSPIQYALLNNEKITGVTLMQMDASLDTGPIIAQKNILIGNNDDYLSLSDKSAELSASLLIKNLNIYIDHKVSPKKQDNKAASYSKIIKKEDGKINLCDDPKKILQKLKAYTPWPGIYFVLKNKRYKLIKAHLNKQNKLAIDIIHPEGKKAMRFLEFKKGYQKLISDFFGCIES